MSGRTFETGATRDTEEEKFDYEGFLSPKVLEAFAAYMHKHRVQKDGKYRESDNWQKLFGEKHYDVCMKSLWRHFMDVWKYHRGLKPRGTIDDALAGIMFNTMAYWFKLLQERDPVFMDKSLRAKEPWFDDPLDPDDSDYPDRALSEKLADDLPEKADVVVRMLAKLDKLYAFMSKAEADLAAFTETVDPYVRIATRKQWLSAIRAATDTEAILLARGTRSGAKQIDAFRKMQAIIQALKEKAK